MPDRNFAGCQVRRLWPSDRDAVRTHFLRLDPETRATRFMTSVNDHVVAAYAERSLDRAGLIYGAFVEGDLRGIGELRPAGRPLLGLWLGRRAEAAFTVERSHRRRGVGAALFRRVVGGARNRGVIDLHVRCLNENAAMRRLALRLGAETQLVGQETNGSIRLSQPTPFSFWYESLADVLDLTRAIATPPFDSARFKKPRRTLLAAADHALARSEPSL